MPLDEWSLTIGEIVGPFGRRGEVKTRIETDFPQRFERVAQICARKRDGSARLYRVSGVRFHKGHAVLALAGVDTIDAAEVLRGTTVQVRLVDAEPLGENEYYIHDLIGCEVVTREGRRIGVVTAVLRSAAHDVYAIGTASGEVLLPAVKQVVKSVEVVDRRIVVAPQPGLLDD